ncbi:MAG: DUF4097 family beta strand repeat-containing protein [Defluviitaleaceae bacterium]|nr:DUF4097 family beta strand repeat-containing protein [Defluviitaleaceae bacterium]MCL2275649.1 DUF4097 family beta strand repeat-containing protein [Defluviitaleaceae bacterium]
MKKQEFINELKRALAQVPPHVCDEIIADISEHFSEGISQGLTEEDVCRKLGQPSAIAEQVLEEYGEYGGEYQERQSGFEGAINSIVDSVGQILGDVGQAFSGRRTNGHEINIDKVFTAIEHITVNLPRSNVRLLPSADGQCRVTVQGRMRYDSLVVENENGTLMIRQGVGSVIKFEIFSFRTSLDTTVYIPAQFNGKIKISTATGNVFANDTNGRLNISAAAGNVTVENHRGEKIDLSTAAGNVKCFCEETRMLQLDSAAGNVEAEITRLRGDTKISTAAGNIKLTAHDVAGDIDVATAAGSAKIVLPREADIRLNVKKPSIGSLSNELAGNPNSQFVLKASTAVGSIKLQAL